MTSSDRVQCCNRSPESPSRKSGQPGLELLGKAAAGWASTLELAGVVATCASLHMMLWAGFWIAGMRLMLVILEVGFKIAGKLG